MSTIVLVLTITLKPGPIVMFATINVEIVKNLKEIVLLVAIPQDLLPLIVFVMTLITIMKLISNVKSVFIPAKTVPPKSNVLRARLQQTESL